jgi:hypothetical protein
MLVRMQSNAELVRELILLGADVNAVNYNNETALYVCKQASCHT